MDAETQVSYCIALLGLCLNLAGFAVSRVLLLTINLVDTPPLKHAWNNVPQVTHKPPEEVTDRVALGGVKALRWSFDWLAGFKTGTIDENKCEFRLWIGYLPSD